jgi:YD repeat-containing protein
MNDAVLGHSLRMEAQLDGEGGVEGWDLFLLDDDHLRFDADGALTEWSSLLIDGTPDLEPLRIDRASDSVTVTDSRGRTLTVPDLEPGTDYFGMPTIVDPVDTRTDLEYEDGRLVGITRGSKQGWTFDYSAAMTPEAAGNSDSSFVAHLSGPEAIDSSYEYYDGNAFGGIDRDDAHDFWGRLGSASVGSDEEARMHRFLYEPYDSATQTVVYRDPGGVEFIHTVDVDRLAVGRTDYVIQEKDPASGALLGRPNYDQVLAGGGRLGDLPTGAIETRTFHSDTKLVTSSEDAHGNRTETTHTAVGDGSTYLTTAVKKPDGSVWAYEYDSDRRLTRAYNPYRGEVGSPPFDHPSTTLVYDAVGNLVEKHHPVVGDEPGVVETWTYDPDTGVVLTHTDKLGTNWRFGYGDQPAGDDPPLDGARARDPFDSGLSTSRAMTKAGETLGESLLRWENAYDELGRVAWEFEPEFGGETAYEYHPLGPVSTIERQKIPTATGGVYGETLQFFYDDRLDVVTRYDDNGSEEWEYNDFGEVVTYTNQLGTETTNGYDARGAVHWTEDAAGNRTTTTVDELQRDRRIDHPKPSPEDPATCQVIEYDDGPDATVQTTQYAVETPGDPVPDEWVRRDTVAFQHGSPARETIVRGPGADELVRELTYDEWGSVDSVTLSVNGETKRTVTHDSDDWGRMVRMVSEAGGQRREYTVDYRPDDQIRSQASPSPDGGTAVRTTAEYDELGRETARRDARGDLLRTVKYRDVGRWMSDGADGGGRLAEEREWGADPSLSERGGDLVFRQATRFNRLGLPTRLWFDSDESSDLAQRFQYDAAGRLIEHVDEHGTHTSYTLNANDAPSVTHRSRRVRKEDVPVEEYDPTDPAHYEVEDVTEFFDYDELDRLHLHRTNDRFERISYDALGRVAKRERGRGEGTRVHWREELRYDASDRVVERTLIDGKVQSFEYDDAARTILSELSTTDTRVQTRATYDWENRVVDFGYRQYAAVGLGVFNDVRLAYEYTPWGDLERKEYRDTGGDLLASQLYEYDDAGMRRRMDVRIKRAGRSPFERAFTYEYGPNARLNRIDDGERSFAFTYNTAALLKRLDRFAGGATFDDRPSPDRTEFTHDPRGQLTDTVEFGAVGGDDSELSTFSCRYQHDESDESDADPWSIRTKDASPTSSPAIRGVMYERKFHTVRGPDHFTQAYGYDSTGTQYATVTTNGPDGAGRTLYDFRLDDRDGLDITDVHRYQVRDTQGRAIVDVPYTVAIRGDPNHVGKRWDSRGSRSPTGSARWPAEFRERNEYDQDGNLMSRRLVQELLETEGDASGDDVPTSLLDLLSLGSDTDTGTGADTPVSDDEEEPPTIPQLTRRYSHDSLGRIIGLGEMVEFPESITNEDLIPGDAPSYRQSMENTVKVQYGPNGELLSRAVEWFQDDGDGTAGGSTIRESVLTLTDAGQIVAEYNDGTGELTAYTLVPGLNYRLSIHRTDDDGDGIGTIYPRYDHKGGTLFATDESAEVVADFGFTGARGERDLFGEDSPPRWLPEEVVFDGGEDDGTPTGLTARQRDLVDVSQFTGPRIDVLLGYAEVLERQPRAVEAVGLDPANPAGGAPAEDVSPKKPHAIVSAAKTIDPGEGWLGIRVLTWQRWIDRIHGVQDSVTFGLSKEIRDWVWDERGEILDPEGYTQGLIVGTVATAAFSGAAGFGRLGTSLRSLSLMYDAVGAGLGFYQGLHALYRDDFQWYHGVGMAPVMGTMAGAAAVGTVVGLRGGLTTVGRLAARRGIPAGVSTAASVTPNVARLRAIRAVGAAGEEYHRTFARFYIQRRIPELREGLRRVVGGFAAQKITVGMGARLQLDPRRNRLKVGFFVAASSRRRSVDRLILANRGEQILDSIPKRGRRFTFNHAEQNLNLMFDDLIAVGATKPVCEACLARVFFRSGIEPVTPIKGQGRRGIGRLGHRKFERYLPTSVSRDEVLEYFDELGVRGRTI